MTTHLSFVVFGLIFILSSSLVVNDESSLKDSIRALVLRESKRIPPEMDPLIKYLSTLGNKGVIPRPGDGRGLMACDECIEAFDTLIALANSISFDVLETMVAELCYDLGILSEAGCQGIVNNYGPVLEFIVTNSDLDGAHACGILIGDCGAVEDIQGWTVQVADGKPPVEEPVLPSGDAPVLKFLHLSDLHVDVTYTPGNSNNCEDELCCSSNSGLPASPSDAAGYWGDYNCDQPVHAVRNTIQRAAEQHKSDIDFVLLTGDYPAHDVYYQGREFNLEVARVTIDLVKEAFQGVPVFPSLGNHEAFPCNT